jgi:alkylated DNA repair protein (DNA oxidative demethylase)
MLGDLFGPVDYGEGFALLPGFARGEEAALVAAALSVAAVAPFRVLETPGGKKMSVAMTNCGAAGWVSDRRGYRYEPADPLTGAPWPAMPEIFADLAARAARAAGYDGFAQDVCLINRYEPGAKLTLHQDTDEADFGSPIVSVSLGLPATFLWGGAKRADKPMKISLVSGDVAVWGGPARRHFHGIAPVRAGVHPLTGPMRLNLTFRKAL